uniref:NADH-ubiquinone oxidoreductase chain 3 n=1 Tax=Onchidella celtica TaxID=36933 RepID=B3DFD3_9EUPU|nr:NADH dehydrogenase subunit 3 [Onchidella celtica]ACE62820.1 NADH dehydrogenase subunit 3 [Onchidella celtica]
MFSIALGFSVILSAALLMIYLFTSYVSSAPAEEKQTPFECGFEPMSETRSPFSIRFFILVVLFLVFDVEVALLFPVLSMLAVGAPILTGITLFLFLLVLLVGLFHEWNEGAIDWVSS